jgi:hypothetical protein
MQKRPARAGRFDRGFPQKQQMARVTCRDPFFYSFIIKVLGGFFS